MPMFPASCPWITTVGGTIDNPEVAADFSSGGFSNYFLRPDYQHDAVTRYIGSLEYQYDGLYKYSASSLGYPDISVQASNFLFILNGETRVMWSTSRGTRASFQLPYPPPRFLLSTQLIVNVQTVAGVILLLNDYRLSQGKSILGWLNLWLYGGGMAGLNDIVAGSNPGRHTDGFSAAIAWDHATGLGTPDFIKIKELIDDLK